MFMWHGQPIPEMPNVPWVPRHMSGAAVRVDVVPIVPQVLMYQVVVPSIPQLLMCQEVPAIRILLCTLHVKFAMSASLKVPKPIQKSLVDELGAAC